MRLIDADKLKARKVYSEERHETVIPTAFVDWEPTVEAVPLKPLAEWLAGYAAPPRNALRKTLTPGDFINHESLTEAWEMTLKEVNDTGGNA